MEGWEDGGSREWREYGEKCADLHPWSTVPHISQEGVETPHQTPWDQPGCVTLRRCWPDSVGPTSQDGDLG